MESVSVNGTGVWLRIQVRATLVGQFGHEVSGHFFWGFDQWIVHYMRLRDKAGISKLVM